MITHVNKSYTSETRGQKGENESINLIDSFYVLLKCVWAFTGCVFLDLANRLVTLIPHTFVLIWVKSL